MHPRLGARATLRVLSGWVWLYVWTRGFSRWKRMVRVGDAGDGAMPPDCESAIDSASDANGLASPARDEAAMRCCCCCRRVASCGGCDCDCDAIG